MTVASSESASSARSHPTDQQPNQQLAIVHGDPFPEANVPPSLATALHHAAKTKAGIRYLEADGAETVQAYDQLLTSASQIATALSGYGLGSSAEAKAKTHSFVILQFSQSVDLIVALWGCFLSGCIPVPISAQASSASGQTLLESAIALLDQPTPDYPTANLTLLTDLPPSAKTLPITVLALKDLQNSIQTTNSSTEFSSNELTLLKPQLDDLALLLLTSGSTGMPKGVQLTHQNIRASAYGMASVNQLCADDITLNWMPLEHVASLVMFHLTEVYLGCEQIHVAREYVLKDPLTWLDLLAQYRVSATWAPNFAYGLVNDQLEAIAPLEKVTENKRKWNLSSIRWMGNGAEAVVGQTARQFLERLIPYGLSPTAISPGYGMTETCSGIVHSRQFSLETTTAEDSFVSLGKPIPGVSIRTVDDADAVVSAGEIGRLQVKGLTVMAGYYERSDSSERPNATAFTPDGWFNTGDLAFIEKGSLTITGRQKEVIILNGVNYYSHEIESVVEAIEGVDVSFTAACGVRGAKDTTEQLAVFFHPVEGIENLTAVVSLVKQIRTQIVNQIGISPTYVIPMGKSEIPKTSIGKIQRSQLSSRFASGEFDARIQQFVEAFQASVKAANLKQSEIEQRISQIWQSVLSVEKIGSSDNFFELGGTSLRLMQVLGHLQNQLAPTLKAVSLFQYPTIATLAAHLKQSDLNAPSLNLRSSLKAKLRQSSSTQQTSEIAVIGMAGRFPGAPNLEIFWQNLKDGVESITFFTDAEMLAAGIDPALIQNPNYVKASPTLEDIDCFDADFFGYSPKEASLMDPQQRLLLECAWESLEAAGYDPLTYEGDIGLFAGATMNTYLLNHVYPNRHTLDPNDSLDTFTLSSFGGFQATVANDKDYLTTRVSYKLNLRGPSLNVQTACSTSLVSIHLAAQSLLQGECDMALAGGVSVETPQRAGYLYQEGMILAKDGHCRAFDADSKGTLFGSGVGLVVLKRLDEAIAHKDFIYAVIKGSAVGNDGGQKVGYLAPLSEGQTRVAAAALTIANTPAETIGYVEAHGTGTQLGDPIEIAALTQAFRYCPDLNTNQKQFCPIGSVKTNVGHLNIASGVVGFIKTALAVHHGQIPPSLHFQRPNPQIDFARSPFYVNTALAKWPIKKTPRRASVNSLGIGGTNVHMVLEEAAVEDRDLSQTGREEIFVLSAKSDAALRELAKKYVDLLADKPDISIADVCFTLGVGRSHFPHRLALVVSAIEDLRTQLQSWLLESPNSVPSGKVAFLFTGQGAQSASMGKVLYETQPTFRYQLDRCAEILQRYDFDLLGVLYGKESELINQTGYTQPVLFAFEYAIAKLWISWGVRPAVVLGHSLGEYVAACVAGVFNLEDALKLVVERGRLIQALPTGETSGGAMLAVAAGVEACEQFLQDGVAIAAINSPENTVLSGQVTAINSVANRLEEQSIRCKRLQVSHAFHSSLMEPMLSDFRRVAESISYQEPTIDIISNLTGEMADRFDSDYWIEHIQRPVRFAQSVEALEREGVTTFLECGPRPVLLTLAQATVFSAPYSWLASIQPRQADNWQILSSLAALYQGGHEIDWKEFYGHREVRRIPLPTYAFQRQRHWMERVKPSQRAVASDQTTHPLLGQKISTPLRQILFQQTLSSIRPDFLQHHRVQNQVLFPGSAFLEIGLAAGAEVLQTALVQLNNVSISQPLNLSEQPTALQTILTPDSDGYHFEIHSQVGDSDWSLHCEGTVCAVEEKKASFVEIEQIKDRLGEVRSPATHYENCDRAGLSYSGPFRSLENIWHTAGEALGQVEIAAEIICDLSAYQIHPAVLDACFQCVLAALPKANDAAYVPIGVESIRCHRPLINNRFVWSHILLRPVKGDAVTVTADVQILDESGQAIASITGLAAKRLSQADRWKDWLYKVEWHPIAAVNSSQFVASRNWLVVADEAEKLEAIALQLTAQNQNCTKVLLGNAPKQTEQYFAVDREDPKGFHALFRRSDQWQGVLYFAGSRVEHNCKTALYLTQALVSCGLSSNLWFITDRAIAVAGRETLNISQSPLLGLSKTIALEHPELSCVCLDFDSDENQQQILSHLMFEISQKGHKTENQIAYRNGTRYAARLTRWAQENVSEAGNLQLKATKRGTLEHLAWQETTRRPPATGEVELSVQATGLNFRDVLNALDLYPGEAGPLGLECAGEVVAVGEGVDGLSVGDMVIAIAPASFSQFVTVSADLAVSKPSRLSNVEAATIPTAFLTAYYALVELAELKAGDRILIHAAAGGVGQAAVQIAQSLGAEVFATASLPKWDFLRQQGIQHVFNSRTLDFAEQIAQQTKGKGVDVVLNSLSGEAIIKSLSTLSADGRFLEIGKAGIWSIAQISHQRPDISYRVIDLVQVTNDRPQLIQSMLSRIATQLQNNSLSPLPHISYPATQAIDAFRTMQQAKHIGKVVITPPTVSPTHQSKAHIQADATYLITGGTGALGLQLAQWLVTKGATSLVLLGRSRPSDHAQQIIDRLIQSRTTVKTLQTDFLDQKRLQTDLAAVLQSEQSPLKGIFHLAGEIDDSLLPQQTWPKFDRVLSAKVTGTWNLHQLTRNNDLDYFVMFSSVASLLGSAGQANYAAANSFLDATAHLRHQQELPALSINWAAWSGSGLADSLEVKQRLSRTGIPLLDPDIGLKILVQLIESPGNVQIGVLPGALESWRNAGIKDSFLTALATEKTPAETTEKSRQKRSKTQLLSPQNQIKSAIQTELDSDKDNDNTTVLSSHLRQQLAIVLGKDAALINDDSISFTDFGLDSLTAVEFRNRLQTSLECVLPVTLVYDYPTLSQLKGYIVNLLTASERPSESNSDKIYDTKKNSNQQSVKQSIEDTLKNGLEDIENISDDEAEALLLQELSKLDQT